MPSSRRFPLRTGRGAVALRPSRIAATIRLIYSGEQWMPYYEVQR